MLQRKPGKLLAVLLLLFVISGTVYAAKKQQVTLNMKDADILSLISTVAEITGKNFVVDPRVKGQVTVVSSKPADREHLYEIFLSVLKVHGFAAVPSGDVIKIVPAQGAKQDSIRTITNQEELKGDYTVTRVVPVSNINAAQLAPILRPLLPQSAHLAAHTDSNTLVISDTAANANRMVEIIERIDQKNDKAVDIFKLRYANASDLVKVLGPLVQGQGGQNTALAPTLVADERTNSILLGGNPDRRLELKALISHLDTPVANEGNTEVIYLNYATANELVAVLTGVGNQQISAENAQATRSASTFDIQADEATNSLIITAPPDLLRSLKSVVRKLDVRRAQVLIEGIIAEIGNTREIGLGVEWDTGPGNNGRARRVDSAKQQLDFLGAGGLSIGYFIGNDLRALIRAFEGDSDNNILSTPSLMTMDNEEAMIHVGQNVPFVTGSFTTNTDTSSNPFQTFERHDVGIKLEVTPQINEGNTISMRIRQEVSSVNLIASVADDGIVTNERTIETNVMVDDRDIVVLGGLIENNLQETKDTVPFIGDIPLLGELFTSRTTKDVKTNLMVFLQPTIVRNRSSNTALTHQKYSYIQQVQRGERDGGVALMPGKQSPLLPDLPPVNEILIESEGETSRSE